MSIKLSDIAILNIHGIDYYCNVNRIDKSEVINLLQNADMTEEIGYYKNYKKIIKFIKIIITYKIGTEIIRFNDIEIEKNKFHCSKYI